MILLRLAKATIQLKLGRQDFFEHQESNSKRASRNVFRKHHTLLYGAPTTFSKRAHVGILALMKLRA